MGLADCRSDPLWCRLDDCIAVPNNSTTPDQDCQADPYNNHILYANRVLIDSYPYQKWDMLAGEDATPAKRVAPQPGARPKGGISAA